MSWGACCTHAMGIPADTQQLNTETLSKDEETILKCWCWCPADSAIPCNASSDLFFWVFFSFTVMQNNRQAPHTGQFLPHKRLRKTGQSSSLPGETWSLPGKPAQITWTLDLSRHVGSSFLVTVGFLPLHSYSYSCSSPHEQFQLLTGRGIHI